MHQLTTTPGIVAMAAAAVALIALFWAVALSVALRRLRAAQRTVLGEHDTDLVAHAAGLERNFAALRAYVEDSARGLDTRMVHVEGRLDGTLAYRAVVRYDAYGEMSGRQSTSIALLDAKRSGVVLSSIHHRDQARMYVKQLRAGRAESELSPEESEAVRLALAGETQTPLAEDLAHGNAPGGSGRGGVSRRRG